MLLLCADDEEDIRTILELALAVFFSSRRRHTRLQGDWSSDVCSSDLQSEQSARPKHAPRPAERPHLPEVGQMVKGVAGVDDVRGIAGMVVGQEAGGDDVEDRKSVV